MLYFSNGIGWFLDHVIWIAFGLGAAAILIELVTQRRIRAKPRSRRE